MSTTPVTASAPAITVKPVTTNPVVSTPSRATILQDIRQAEGRVMTFLMGMERRLGSKIDALKAEVDALGSGDATKLEALAAKIKSNAAALQAAVTANTPKV